MICVYRYSYMLIDIHKHNIEYIYIYVCVCLLSMHVDYMIPFFMCATWSWWLGIKIPILMTSIGLIICQLYCFRNGCIPHVCVCVPTSLSPVFQGIWDWQAKRRSNAHFWLVFDYCSHLLSLQNWICFLQNWKRASPLVPYNAMPFGNLK